MSALGVGASAAGGARSTAAARGARSAPTPMPGWTSHGDERGLGVARRSPPIRASCSWTSPQRACPRRSAPLRARRQRRPRPGRRFLLVDHDVALVLDVCERSTCSTRGALAEGSPQEIRADSGRAPRTSARAQRPRSPVTALRSRSSRPVRRGRAVRGLALEVKPGQVVGLIGPNGAGKSSTLHAIMGSASIAGGEVLFDGRSLWGGGRRTWRGAASRSCPKAAASSASSTVEENLRLGLAAGRKRSNGYGMARAYELFPVLRGPFAARRGALGRPAAAAALGRALAAGPEVCCSTSRRSARAEDRRCHLRRVGAVREAGLAVLFVEQRAQRTVALPTTPTCRETPHSSHARPEDTADTDRLVAAPRMTVAFLDLSWPVFADGSRSAALHAHRGRHRPRLRRASPRQLRLRPLMMAGAFALASGRDGSWRTRNRSSSASASCWRSRC